MVQKMAITAPIPIFQGLRIDKLFHTRGIQNPIISQEGVNSVFFFFVDVRRYFNLSLTLSRRLDVPNVTFLPATGADLTLRTSSLQCQVGKDRHEGFYIIMWGGMKGLRDKVKLPERPLFLHEIVFSYYFLLLWLTGWIMNDYWKR